MSWYLFGILMAASCFGLAGLFASVLIQGQPPLWASLILWPGILALVWQGVRFIADMVANDRRARRH